MLGRHIGNWLESTRRKNARGRVAIQVELSDAALFDSATFFAELAQDVAIAQSKACATSLRQMSEWP
jgi:hypothetical protein